MIADAHGTAPAPVLSCNDPAPSRSPRAWLRTQQPQTRQPRPQTQPSRPLTRGTALALAACSIATLLAACGRGASPSAAITTTCKQVSAVLADGPERVNDPAGQAEAQILPLARIRTSDPALRAAISALAAAYARFFASSGKSAGAAAAVAAATKRIDRLCPGAAA